MIKIKTKHAIVLAIMTIALSMFIGFKVGDSGYKGQLVNDEVERYKQSEKSLLKVISRQQSSIINSNFRYDSLQGVIKDINIRRKINYRLYTNEVKRNEKILTISDAWIANDSILRAAGIR